MNKVKKILNYPVLFREVYKIVKEIPKGKVATYGFISRYISIKTSGLKISPRMVGRVLHKNSDPENIPCHRVVRSDGTLAKGYAFGGMGAQRKLLVSEGIKFSKEGRIDLKTFQIK